MHRFNSLRSFVSSSLSTLALVAAIGCGGGAPGSDAKILSFQAEPAALDAPDEVSLSWRTSGATSLRLLQGETALDLGDAALAEGSLQVFVAADVTFTLIAADRSGREVRAKAKVAVGTGGQPAIASFEAPPFVEAEPSGSAKVILRWGGIQRAAELRLERSSGPTLDLDPAEAEGSVEVEIATNTEFTLRAINGENQTTKTLTVELIHLPSVDEFVADRSRVGTAEEVRLSWTTSHAVSVELWVNKDRLEDLDDRLVVGEWSVPVFLGSTIELRAKNEVGTEASAFVEVEVGSPIIEELHLSAEALWLGEAVEVSWVTAGGSELSLRHMDSEEVLCQRTEPGEVNASSCLWTPEEPGLYLLELGVSNSSGTTSELREIAVGVGALIESFQLQSPAYNAGERLQFTWSVRPDPAGNEPTLRLVDDRGGSYPFEQGASGLELILAEAGTYLFTLEATTDDPRSSPVTATAQVEIHALPTVELQVTPKHFDDAQAEEVEVSWTTSGAAFLTLSTRVDGVEVETIEIAGAEIASGSWGFIPMKQTTVRLRAANTIGGSASAEQEITLAPTEIVRFSASPTSFTQGQPVTLSWETTMADEVRLDFLGGKTYLREETSAPYLDLEGAGGIRLPLKTDCGGSVSTSGCAHLDFPAGFLFPFGDDLQDSISVYTPGFLAFRGDRPSVGVSEGIPTAAERSWIHLMPFWDSLAWDPLRYPEGNVFYALLEEGDDRALVIQWKDVGFYRFERASMNFEVLLWESGAFEYRYGAMLPRDSGIPPERLYNLQTTAIGYQTEDRNDFDELAAHMRVPVFGRPAQRTFSYRPVPRSLPRSGELVWHPYTGVSGLTVTLEAERGDVKLSRSVNLAVSRKPIIEFSPELIAPTLVGEKFLLGWRTLNATKVAVVDASGIERCAASEQTSVDEGICTLREETPGVHEYRVLATGANGFVQEQTIKATVFGAFGIHSFTSDRASVEKGGGVTLRWLTFNTVEVRLLRGDVELVRDDQGGSGSFFVDSIEETTEFILRAVDELGVVTTETLTVAVWAIDFPLQANRTSVRPGEPIKVTVNPTLRDDGSSVEIFGRLPLVETHDAASRFVDLSEVDGATPLVTNLATNVWVDLPFAFPYMGESHRRVQVAIHGYLSFGGNVVARSANFALPSRTDRYVSLAPFWNNLNPWSGVDAGQIWIGEVGGAVVVQWSRMSLGGNSSNAVKNNLNFQVALYPDGVFEYRYGIMGKGGPHSGCKPNSDCSNEAAGATATIGYQWGEGSGGYTFHFSGTTSGDDNQPVLGGLENRSFRYPRGKGPLEFTMYPNQSETFSFCAPAGQGPDEAVCKELSIDASFGFRSVQASKDSVKPGEAVTLSWRSVGGTELKISDERGVVFETTDLATIDAGSLELRPSGHTVYDIELHGGARYERVRLPIEYDAMTVFASTTQSTGPGSEVTLSWTVDSAWEGRSPMIAAPMEETDEDFYDLDISTDPEAQLLIGANANNTNFRLNFKDGFTFPYFGRELSSIGVTTDGYLDLQTRTSGNNAEVPAAAQNGKILLPFWDDLHTRVQGRVYAKPVGSDRYVIQWSRMSLNYGSTNDNQGNLNFMVVLHRSGDFEFRYGAMLGPPLATAPGACYPDGCINESNGSSATIGYVEPDGRFAQVLHFGGVNRAATQKPVAGRLAFRSWISRRAQGDGSIKLEPIETSQYSVCAYEQVSDIVACSPLVEIETPWGIDLFQASSLDPRVGEEVSLQWKVLGLDSLRILQDDTELFAKTGVEIPLLGSVQVTIDAPTVFTLEAGSFSRIKTATISLAPRQFELDVIEPPAGRYFPGAPLTIEWDARPAGEESVVMVTPLGEIEAGQGKPGAFIDLEDVVGASIVTLSGPSGGGTLQLPFMFPYMGGAYEDVRVYANGFLSFLNSAPSQFVANTPLPNDAITQRIVHLAPFWDSLRMESNDRIYYHSPDPQTAIIQWRRFNSGAGAENQYSLNFQVVLYADGRFEYRYGEMRPLAELAISDGCSGDGGSCDATPYGVTVGYQTTDGGHGMSLHHGEVDLSAVGEVRGNHEIDLGYPGGFSGRSFAYSPALRGAASVSFGKSSTFQVCALTTDYKRCRDVSITSVADPGDLAITELTIDPAGGQRMQWFEVRNLTKESIDLDGFEIAATGGSHSVAGALVVAPGSFVTLAASEGVSFRPDYVYGDTIPLSRHLDNLAIKAGTATIAAVKWDLDWTIPVGEALSLDSAFHITGAWLQADFSRWCPSGVGGSPGEMGPHCLDAAYSIDPLSSLPFIDISGSGTRFREVEGSSKLAMLPLSVGRVPFFGQSQSRTWIASAGWISFSDFLPTTFTNLAAPNLPRSLTSTPTGPLLAAFWGRPLECDRTAFDCRFFYERREVEGQSVLILQWDGYQFHGAGSITFQAQIWESGDIVVAFADVEIPFVQGSAGWLDYHGANSWIGLEAKDPENFVSAHYKNVLPLANRSFHFRKR